MLKTYTENDTSEVVSDRKHTNVNCNCRHCKQFDYAKTATLPQSSQAPRLPVIEFIQAIDSETWDRYNYILAPKKPQPYNKYQRY